MLVKIANVCSSDIPFLSELTEMANACSSDKVFLSFNCVWRLEDNPSK